MSLIDVSSKFSFVNTPPTASPCGRYIAYVHSARLIIRDTDSLERVRTVALAKSGSFVKVAQICWEPPFLLKSSKVAIVVKNTVRVLDAEDDTVDVEILEDDVFAVEKVTWLGAGKDHVETAYKGSKQIVVYSESGLMMKVYSLDYRRSPVLEIGKPLVDVITRNGSDLYTVASMNEQKVICNTVLNSGSTSSILYQTELKAVTNVDKIIISPESKWMACRENVIGGISIALFSVMGDVTGKSGPLFRYSSETDPFGSLDIEFLNDDTLLLGDHTETINVLEISKGFILAKKLLHSSLFEGSSAWRQNSDITKFLRRSQPVTVPHIDGLPLQSQGISKIKSSGNFIFSVTHSMPTSVFLWDITQASASSSSPIGILITNNRIKEIITLPDLPNFFLIYTEDSICFWNVGLNSTTPPVSLPFYSDDNSQIRGVQIINVTKATIQLLVWTSNRNFYTIQSRLSYSSIPPAFENMDTQEISVLRRGSPALVDDSSRVMELAAGVQQSEWGQNLTKSIQVEDTFVGKKKSKRIDQLKR